MHTFFYLIKGQLYLHSQKQQRSVRLGVRTPGFHPGSRGSIPLRTTTNVL